MIQAPEGRDAGGDLVRIAVVHPAWLCLAMLVVLVGCGGTHAGLSTPLLDSELQTCNRVFQALGCRTLIETPVSWEKSERSRFRSLGYLRSPSMNSKTRG